MEAFMMAHARWCQAIASSTPKSTAGRAVSDERPTSQIHEAGVLFMGTLPSRPDYFFKFFEGAGFDLADGINKMD
jgi:hypothetical protein